MSRTKSQGLGRNLAKTLSHTLPTTLSAAAQETAVTPTNSKDGGAADHSGKSGTEAGAGANDEHYFSIGELADEFDITTRTIRFYEARGLLIPQRFRSNRAYSRRDRARLKLILRGKNLGFSLEDIAEYLSLYDSDPGQVTQTRLLLDKVEAHIAGLNSKNRDIERTLGELSEIRNQCLGHLKRGR
jgi:DNA-binding transcriptional MerR regulator